MFHSELNENTTSLKALEFKDCEQLNFNVFSV